MSWSLRLAAMQRIDQVRRLLAGDLWHVVDLGESGPVPRNAVAADAHRGLVAVRELGIAGRSRLLGGRQRRAQNQRGAQRCVEEAEGHQLKAVDSIQSPSSPQQAGSCILAGASGGKTEFLCEDQAWRL